jgi:hypothetical protein
MLSCKSSSGFADKPLFEQPTDEAGFEPIQTTAARSLDEGSTLVGRIARSPAPFGVGATRKDLASRTTR